MQIVLRSSSGSGRGEAGCQKAEIRRRPHFFSMLRTSSVRLCRFSSCLVDRRSCVYQCAPVTTLDQKLDKMSVSAPALLLHEIVELDTWFQDAAAEIRASTRRISAAGGALTRLASMSRTRKGSMMSAAFVERPPPIRGSPASKPRNLLISAENIESVPGSRFHREFASWSENALRKAVASWGGRF